MFIQVMGQEATEQNGLFEELHMAASAMTSHSKRLYTKDFLLSIGELEECKKVPAGLDSSLLRETQPKLHDEKGVPIPGASSRGLICTVRENDAHSESPPDVPEWRRPSSLPGSPFLKSGPRQAEPKVSSPRPGPARAGNNPARSIMGRSGSARWELRSNGDDRDRDVNRTQFEWELSSPTESGGRLHNRGLARSGLVVSQEHDGLLGSGGPIVHRGMIQTPTLERHRAERISRIGRTGEVYHSPRGGKASRNFPVTQHSRRVDTDSISDETFGSDDWPNGERSEQERQRRDEFEQMRKELRKKPLNTARNHIDSWLGEGSQSTETFVSSSPGTPQSSSSKDDVLKPRNKPVAMSSTPRLLVPPGFSKPNISKISSPKENHKAAKSYSSHVKDDDMHALKQTNSDDVVKLDNEDHFSSLLMKLNQFEDENQKSFSPSQSPMMSKFARWFPSQGPNHNEGGSNSEPLIVVTKSEDLGLQREFFSPRAELAGSSENDVVSKLSSVTSLIPAKSKGSVLPMPAGPSLEDVEKVMTAGADVGQDVGSGEALNKKIPSMLEDHHLLPDSNHAVMNDAAQFAQNLDSQRPRLTTDVPAKKTAPVFLTCEDLEQSLLSESVHDPKIDVTQRGMDANVNVMQLLQLGSSKREGRSIGQGWVTEQGSGDVPDGSASTHLMSLLQKNGGRASPLGDSCSSISAESCAQSKGQNDNVEDRGTTAEIISLETLFGRKFVNELRSVGEPVSSKQIVDESILVGKEDTLLSSVISNKSNSRRPGHAEVAFHEEVGWKYDGHVVVEPKGSEIYSGSDLQGDCLTDVSAHVHSPLKASKNLPSSRGVAVNGAQFGKIRQQKVSHHPYQLNHTHGQHHEGHHHPASEIPSQKLHVEQPIEEPHQIHENSLYAMGMYAPNSHLYPFQEEFLRAGNDHRLGHFEGPSVLAGGYRGTSAASAGYPESIQMGFNPSQGVSDSRMGGSRISPLADRWFPGDHIQTSQGVAGFNPYQHLVIQERNSGFGVSGLGGLGPGVQSYNVGLPSDKRGQSEIAYGQYTISSSRPNYG